MNQSSHQIQLLRRPVGLPSLADFTLTEVALPELQEGEVRVANQWLSVDPYMRGRMSEAKSYVPPFPSTAPSMAAPSAWWKPPVTRTLRWVTG